MLKIGTIELGEQPCVAVALQAFAPESDLQAVAGRSVLLELRLDAAPAPTPDALREIVEAYRGHPLLATIRHAAEGGGWNGTEAARLACYREIIPLVQAVDVEIEAGTIAAAVVAAARESECATIGSFHDFQATPEREQLEAIHVQGRDLGFDIVKVAARCNTRADLQRLAEFTLAHRSDHVITVGMGAHGLASRVFFPALGSLVTYTFLGAPTAPGQLNLEDTLKYLDSFYPRGA